MLREAGCDQERQHCPDKGGGDAECTVGEEAFRQHIDHIICSWIKNPQIVGKKKLMKQAKATIKIKSTGYCYYDGKKSYDEQGS